MVIYDQLRVSDNGQALIINAHVNKAKYFDDIYLKKITICTEDQVSETNPLAYGEDFIYQEDIEPMDTIKQVSDRPQILSEQQLINKLDSYGGVSLDITGATGAETNYLSLVLSGKYSVLDTGLTPKLVVTTPAYNPETDNLNSPEILFTVDGVHYDEKGHQTWRFKGKGETKLNSPVHIYLYSQNNVGQFTFVRIDATDDFNFLHFLWNEYSLIPGSSKKEVNLVLTKNDFNEKFTQSDLSHNMFFVYIECEGTPDPCTPCRLDEMTTLGVTFDYGIIFNQAMGYTRELGEDCTISKNFIDFILNFDALKLAVETEHYVPAIGFWKRITQSKSFRHGGLTKPCGCYG